jgi:hypothetical protein
VRIGGALAEARSEAGMTVTEVSDRTRIRATIIRDIERDDYASCGGDYYARGHIRAIARVVGTDPVPLIEEYDAARLPPAEFTETSQQSGAGQPPGPVPVVVPPAGDRTVPARGHASLTARARQRPASREQGTGQPDRAGPGTGQSGGSSGFRPGGITAAQAFRPAMPLEPRRRTAPNPSAMIALALVAAVGLLIYLLVSGGPGSGRAAGAPRASRARRPAAAAGRSTAPKAKPSAAARAAVTLIPVSATAFGPGGAGQGDNQSLASLAIDSSSTTSWQTDWYSTASFAGLQQGTGLLLDMGKAVSVSLVRLLLGPAAGGTVQIRAGSTPDLASLSPVGQAANAGGAVTVPVATPVPGRYLLIWFTSLPPDSNGTYQGSIFSVSVTGTP